MTLQDSRRWSWWAVDVENESHTPEIYQINEPTRDEALRAALRVFGSSAIIALVEATQDGPFDSRPFEEDGDGPLMEKVFETWADANCNRWGEGDGPPWGDIAQEVARRLNDVFETAITENHDTLMEGAWTFTAQRNFEIVMPIQAI